MAQSSQGPGGQDPHAGPHWRAPAPAACRRRPHPKALAASSSVTLLFVSVTVDETTQQLLDLFSNKVLVVLWWKGEIKNQTALYSLWSLPQTFPQAVRATPCALQRWAHWAQRARGVDTGRSGQLEPRTPPRSLPELAHAAPSGAIWGPRLGWGEVGWWEDKVSP